MPTTLSSKQASGVAAAALVRDGMLLGLGTGSTVAHFLEALAKRIEAENLSVKGVPTSLQTERQATALGIPLVDLDDYPELDLAVDGADEVDPQFRMIKGGGGALLREKMVARAASKVAIVVGEGKRVDRLGREFHLPVEVVPFGWPVTARWISDLGCQTYLRSTEGGEAFETDNGNFILDCRFPDGIVDPVALHADLSQTPGVVEVGLFLGLCHVLIEGTAEGTATTYES